MSHFGDIPICVFTEAFNLLQCASQSHPSATLSPRPCTFLLSSSCPPDIACFLPFPITWLTHPPTHLFPLLSSDRQDLTSPFPLTPCQLVEVAMCFMPFLSSLCILFICILFTWNLECCGRSYKGVGSLTQTSWLPAIQICCNRISGSVNMWGDVSPWDSSLMLLRQLLLDTTFTIVQHWCNSKNNLII